MQTTSTASGPATSGPTAGQLTTAASGTGTPAITPTTANSLTTTSMTNYVWALLVLSIGNFPLSNNNITSMLDWMASENDPSTWTGTAGANNPLNNGYGSGGGDGTGSYPDLITAAEDVVKNLDTGKNGYSNITAALNASAAPSVTAQAIITSKWAGGHYNNGASFHTGSVPEVTAASSASNGATKGVAVGTTPPTPSGGGDWVDILKAIPGLGTAISAAQAAAGAVGTAESVEAAAATVLGDISSAAFWKRIGVFALGAGLTVTGLVIFISTTKPGQQVKSVGESAGAVAALAA